MPIPSIQSQLAIQYSSDGIVDLYKLDCTAFGGSTHFFSPQCYIDGTPIYFNSQAYTRLPIGIENIETHSTTQPLPQPTLSVSNAGGMILSAVITLGDLIGAVVTHWKTKVSYLDGGVNADPTKFVGPQTWYIFQKSLHTNQLIQFTLASPLDRPGLLLPVRQVLKDAGVNPGIPVYFPGISSYRINPLAP